jgi:hypothetical protein
MIKDERKKITGFAKLISILLSVLVLNLCISVPSNITTDGVDVPHYESNQTTNSNRFLLQFAFECIAGECIDIETNSGTDILEELNEVKENWHHQIADINSFGTFFTENLHPPHHPFLFLFLEDARLSPPPEFQA